MFKGVIQKGVCVFLAMLMCLWVCPVSTIFQSVYAEQTVSGTCGENLTWSFDEETGTLTISGSGEMEDYRSTIVPWEEYRNQISNIIIENGVTSLGMNRFNYYPELNSLTVSGSVINFCMGQFSSNVKLSTVTIQNGVTNLGDFMFASCGELSTIYLPSSIISIDYGTFSGCISLSDIYYAETQEEWRKINIGIENTPLHNTQVHCTDTTFRVYDASWSLEDGVLTVSGSGTMGYYDVVPWNSQKDSITKVVIEEGITDICTLAFSDCSNLSEVTIPSTVTQIGEAAFLNSSLSSIDIPDNVAYIGNSAFAGCVSLETVIIPESVTRMEQSVFRNCTNLTSVSLENEVPIISEYMFSGCSSLANVYIPYSVKSIGRYAFQDCPALSQIQYGGTQSDWNSIDGIIYVPVGIEIYDCNNERITDIYYHSVLSDNLYWSIDLFTGELTISGKGEMPQFVRSPSSWLTPWFEIRDSIKEVIIEDGVTTISVGAISKCYNLTTVTFPASIIQIDNCAFMECSSLTDVYYSGPCNGWDSISIIENGNECLFSAELHHIVTSHPYGEWKDNGDGTHTHICSYCGETETAAHRYQNYICIDCGYSNYIPVFDYFPDYSEMLSEPEEESEPVLDGWMQTDNGAWLYIIHGEPQTGWVKDGNTWYYMDEDGVMLTGWVKVDGTWYYLMDSGAMKTGWLNDNGTWYYLKDNGAMATGWVYWNENWYYLDASGAMIADKWVEYNSAWYYLGSSGAMLTNTVTPDGYYVDEDGAWIE